MSEAAATSKSVRLVEYLEHLARIRSATISDIAFYEKVLWLDRLPKEAECYSRHRSEQHEDPDLWVEIRKPKEPKLPSPPEVCGRWVDRESLHQDKEPRLFETLSPPVDDSAQDEPGLASESGLPSGEGSLLADLAAPTAVPLRLEEHPEVTHAWSEYLETKWRPWAAERRRWQSIQNEYAKLFEMHSALQSKGEQLELLIGVGCLCWKHDGQQVCRHMLAGRISLVFEEKRGRFQIRPGDGGLELAAEFDMLPTQAIPKGLELETREKLKAIGEDLWERPTVDGVLSSIAHRLSEGGSYDSARNDLFEPFMDRPQIAFAPAIFLRKRSQRGVEQFLKKTKDLLEGGAEPTRGWGDLSEQTGPSRGKGESDDSGNHHKPGAPEPEYLPLPVNDEQKQILKALKHPIGALVQGPPGTGKSHTIANLICHLLATGKRVLITAQTPRALQVLREKLPEEIRPLAVSLLGTGTDDQLSLEQSVRGITERLDDPRAQHYREMASEYSTKRQRAAERIADLRHRHRTLREKDTLKQHVAGYSGTAEEIARSLNEESATYAWFEDTIPHDCVDEVDVARLREALAVLRRLSPEYQSRLVLRRPRIEGTIPAPNEFRRLVAQSRSAKAVLDRRPGTRNAAVHFPPESLPRVRTAIESLRNLEISIQNASKRPQPWIAGALTDVLTEQDRPWFQLQTETQKVLAEIRDQAAAEDRRTVTVPSASDWPTLKHDAEVLKNHLEAGRKARWWLFRSKPIKACRYLTSDVRIDGMLCDNAESLGLLVAHTRIQLAVGHVWKLWDGRANPKARSLAMQVQEVEELQEALRAVLAAYRGLEEAKSAISELGDCFEPHWHESESRAQVRDELEARAAHIEFAGAQAKIQEATDALQVLMANPDSDREITESLLDAIQHRDAVAFATAAERLGRLVRDAAELVDARSSIKFTRTLLPLLASNLDSQPENPDWDVRLGQLAAAMNNARASQWLDEFITSTNLNEIERQLDSAERDVSEHTTKEAALLAWAYVIDRMEEKHRKALIAWQQAIRALGKGTGKYAFRHRREAQAQLQKCRDAIPAWIMPLHRVFDGIDPLPGMFDVVIVDEASQCGPDALPLFFIGKKVVIVGDDKQISPSHTGINLEDVHRGLLNNRTDERPEAK